MAQLTSENLPAKPQPQPPRPPRDFSNLRTIALMVVMVLALVVVWEGGKAFARANDYELAVLGSTINLSIFNNTKLPHLMDIARSFVEPAQRNGPPLWRILVSSGLFTLAEAIAGFVFGGLFGFLLAVIFAHSRLLQRGLLPYVVASQTIPVIAIAPMVVVWSRQANFGFTLLGFTFDSQFVGVALIAAFLTFFPVTIYTLRGLTDVPATALELMESYAASRWQIFVKLRLPNALPLIFTALKISATASVVGAIIGELPSGIQNGLGIRILNFMQFYNQSPPRLWATIVAAAVLGIVFFSVVATLERFVVRWQVEETE